jgi:ethanolamine utilization protein EutQ (cupin superfamily)
MEPAQLTNQTVDEDIKKINEAIEVLKMKGVQTLEGDFTGQLEEFMKKRIEQVKKLMECKDEASAECRRLMGEVTISVIMYDLIKKGLPLLMDGVKSGVIKAEDLPKILEGINLMLGYMETLGRFLLSLDEKGIFKLMELIATDREFLNKLNDFIAKVATERAKLEQLLNEDREFVEKLRSIAPNLPSLIAT